jgi:hypothetical protein
MNAPSYASSGSRPLPPRIAQATLWRPITTPYVARKLPHRCRTALIDTLISSRRRIDLAARLTLFAKIVPHNVLYVALLRQAQPPYFPLAP